MHPYLYQTIIATPILTLHIIIGIIILLALFKKDTFLKTHFQKYGMVYALVVAIASIVGSLGFSEGYAFAPCKLCWIQRIFHYPQAFIFAIALYYKDTRAWTYSIWLSIVGALFAGYQVLIQFSPSLAESSFCNIVPAAESCSDILIQAYGYISIPVMSLTLFVCLIILFLYQRKK
ncbi:MAG: disulfide bond formation protein B [Candidatus Pacebacteria bacterium]|nr:disulfide bond formation protein B [Candidatus Paceibacterota bacterium]